MTYYKFVLLMSFSLNLYIRNTQSMNYIELKKYIYIYY